jgi:hypothetical protein
MSPWRRLIELLALLTLGASTTLATLATPSGAAAGPPRTPPSVASAGPCGTTTSAHKRIDHVIWIWMENESYVSIIGSPDAKYETSLAKACGLANNYQAITHPSLPNYLAATGGSTFGVTDDGEPASHPLNAPSIFSEVAASHDSWRGYAESMPTNCDRVTTGVYAARHNPAVYYVPLRPMCAQDDIPMGSLATGAFAVAARTGHLPNFAFVTPNICDDAHSCPVAHGDAWLSEFMPIIFASPQYRAGSVAVFLTFDEGNVDNRVPTIVASASLLPGTVSTVLFSHYSLLHTAEQLLGLPLLGNAAKAPSMVAAFHL